MTYLRLFLPVLLACFFNTGANALWKIELTRNPLALNSFWKLIFSPHIIGGILFYVASMMLFFYLLSNYKLSVVIPLTSMTYVLNVVAARIIFKEELTVYQIAGALIMIVGMIVIAQTPNLRVEE